MTAETAKPGLREALRSSYFLRRDKAITDVILQGIARNGSAIIQAIALRRSATDPRQRQLVSLEQPSRSDPSRLVQAVHTVETLADGSQTSWNSMLSRPIRPDIFTTGWTHTVGTGKSTSSITKMITRRGSFSWLGSIGQLTAPEGGLTQLIGLAHCLDRIDGHGRIKHDWRMHMLADRQIVADISKLRQGFIDRQVPIKDPYDARFRDAGGYGVAHALFNTERNQTSDYAQQPALVSLGRNRGALSLEAIADHLRHIFVVDAVAVRRIERDDASVVSQYAWNAKT